jgi:hypothetical protein
MMFEKLIVKGISLPNDRCEKLASGRHRPPAQQDSNLRSHLATWEPVEPTSSAPKAEGQMSDIPFSEQMIAQSRSVQ